MKPVDTKHFTVGPRLTLIFALLVAVIWGGNALLIWQFQIAKEQADHLSDVSQKLISVLRLQSSVLSFHQRLGELADSKNARLLRAESEFLQDALFKQLQQTRSVLTHASDGTHADPLFSAALEAIELSVSTQLHALNALATSGDWDAVGARMADKQPLESKASALVESVDQEFSAEQSRSNPVSDPSEPESWFSCRLSRSPPLASPHFLSGRSYEELLNCASRRGLTKGRGLRKIFTTLFYKQCKAASSLSMMP